MVFGVVEAVDEDVCAHCEEDTETDGGEGEAVLPCVKSVDGRESVRVCGKESEKHREGECGV